MDCYVVWKDLDKSKGILCVALSELEATLMVERYTDYANKPFYEPVNLASFESCKGSLWWVVECLVSRDKCPRIEHGPRVFLLCESEDEMKEKVVSRGLADPYKMYEAWWNPNDKRSNVLLKMIVEARSQEDALNQWQWRFEKYKKNEWLSLYYLHLIGLQAMQTLSRNFLNSLNQ